MFDESRDRRAKLEAQKAVIKQGLSEYFLFTIEGREDIKDKEPKRLIALKAVEVPLESIYKLSDRTGDQGFTKFYRFKNVKLLDDHGKEKKLPAMENLGLSPLPNGTVRLFSEYKQGSGLRRRHRDQIRAHRRPRGSQRRPRQGHHHSTSREGPEDRQRRCPAVQTPARRKFVLYYDLIDYDETFFFQEELVSGKPPAKIEVERQFHANVVLWGSDSAQGLDERRSRSVCRSAYVAGHVERVDQQHVKYFLDLKPGKKQLVEYSVTYKRRKVGPELNTEKKREPWKGVAEILILR